MTTRELQRKLNHFTGTRLRYVTPLRVDGKKGPATCKRIQLVKYYLGYTRKWRTGEYACKVDSTFVNRLTHPTRKSVFAGDSYNRARKRRAFQRAHAKKPTRKVTGIGSYDGVPCANVAIPILDWCRSHGWRGRLVSGWRSRAYSQHLCYAMCGRPSCPGRCAGVNTNHVGAAVSQFAVDVSDYGTFGRVVARCPIRPKIFNALGSRDPVHFSPSGR